MLQQLKNKAAYFSLAIPAFAQNTIKIAPGTGSQFSSLTNITPGSLVSGAISLILLIVALVFFFMLVWGGLKWVMSEGEQKAVEGARNQITSALIGLAIVFAAWAILKLIQIVFGIDILGNLTIPTMNP